MYSHLQNVTPVTADEIKSRYLSKGWGIGELFFHNESLIMIEFLWPKSEDPVFPILDDLK